MNRLGPRNATWARAWLGAATIGAVAAAGYSARAAEVSSQSACTLTQPLVASSKPGAKATRRLGLGSQLIVLEVRKSWTKVRADGRIVYLKGPLPPSACASAPSALPSLVTHGAGSVCRAKAALTLTSKAGGRGRKRTLEAGDSVRVVEVAGAYAKVQRGKLTGYALRDSLESRCDWSEGGASGGKVAHARLPSLSDLSSLPPLPGDKSASVAAAATPSAEPAVMATPSFPPCARG
jgi:hypothetical protein